MDIKDIIFTRRKELGYSLEELGRLVGVSKQTVQKWESGKINDMRRSNIATLSKVLNVSIESLMGWEDEPASVSEITPTSPEIDRLLTAARQLSPEKLHTLVQVAEGML